MRVGWIRQSIYRFIAARSVGIGLFWLSTVIHHVDEHVLLRI